MKPSWDDIQIGARLVTWRCCGRTVYATHPERGCGRCRRQRDPARDARLTESFHRMLSGLRPPRRPVDGMPWDPVQHPIEWPGWPRVQIDVRFLK